MESCVEMSRDLETPSSEVSCVEMSPDVETPSLPDDTFENIVSITICGVPMGVDEDSAALYSKGAINKANNNNNNKREKRKTMAAKKKPFSRPPRPPKGFSLDASDQKLIKGISELATIKHTRIERMKALKKMKVAKASSTSSSRNLIAMAFTIIFCLVIIFQESKGVAVDNIIAVQDKRNFSSSGVP